MNSILHFATFFDKKYQQMCIKICYTILEMTLPSRSIRIEACPPSSLAAFDLEKFIKNNIYSFICSFFCLFILLQGKLEGFEGGKAAHGLLTRLVLNPL